MRGHERMDEEHRSAAKTGVDEHVRHPDGKTEGNAIFPMTNHHRGAT